nr:Chain C, Peptide G13E [Toxoplasma gondii]
GLLPELPAVGG